MSIKNLIYSLTILVSLTQAQATSSKEADVRCIESTEALQKLEKEVFDKPLQIEGSTKTLRQLEIERAQLEAKKSIIDSFSAIHKQREDFLKRLNPLSPNSFYSKDMNAKAAVKETQKQLVSNYILSSITESISAILEKDEFLQTKEKKILEDPEWKKAKTKAEKFRILAGSNPYKFIREKCKSITPKIGQEDACSNFTNINDNRLATIFAQTDQDMVEKVTTNFFNAFYTSQNDGKNIDEELKKIQQEHITSHIKEGSLESERNILLSSLLEKPSDNSKSFNLSHFYKVHSIDPNKSNFASAPFSKESKKDRNSSVDEIKKLDTQFETAKTCYLKKSFGLNIECNGEKSIANFFDGINKLNLSQVKPSGSMAEESLSKNSELKKFNAKDIFRNVANEKIKKLGELEEKSDLSSLKFDQMRSLCGDLAPIESDSFAESLWKCVDDMNKSDGTSNSKIALKSNGLDKELENNFKHLQAAKNHAQEQYSDIVKYSAVSANGYCKDTETDLSVSCTGVSNVTSLVLGSDKSFANNLENVEWNVSGRNESEEILKKVTSKCKKLTAQMRQEELARAQTNLLNTTTDRSSVKDVCSSAENDYENLKAKTPSKKQIEFRKNYITKYNRSTGEMEPKKRTGTGTMFLKAAGQSLLTSGLPLYLQNQSLKNNLPFQTQQAIYQKNYMYMVNNPQYWSTTMFTGYGGSSYLSGQTGSNYYNFSN